MSTSEPPAPAIDALLAAIGIVEDAARARVHEALSRARVIAIGDPIEGLAIVSPVPLADAAWELEWFLPRPGAEIVARARRLLEAVLDALRSAEAASIRFVGAPVQRGFVEPHVLEAAGLERRGRVPSFFGGGDDLFVLATVVAPRASIELDPTNPADLYDAAFAYRDFAAERDFLLACARAHGTRPVRRVASWGCGSGRHLRAFAEIGIEGVGLDDDREQLALATRLATARTSLPRGRAAVPAFVAAPLDAKVDARPVDLSFSMLSVVHRLATEAALVAHLEAAAALLLPGGVHVIEATHPKDLARAHTSAWTELRGRHAIHSRFRVDGDRHAADATVAAHLDVRARDQASGAVVGTLQQQERWLVPDESGWRALVARAGVFELAATLGDFQLDVSSDQPGAWRVLVVLRRKG